MPSTETNAPLDALNGTFASIGEVATVLPESDNEAEDSLPRDTAVQLAALTELICRVCTCKGLESGAQRLVDEVAEHFDCHEVLVGFRRTDGGPCKLIAIAGTSGFDPGGASSEAVESVFEECIARGKAGVWPTNDPRERHALLAHRQFARSLSYAEAHILSSLLQIDGETHGSLVVVNPNDRDPEPVKRFLSAAEEPVAGALQLLTRAEGNWFTRMVARTGERLRETKSGMLLLIGTLTVAALLCPLRYRVHCDCELQPATRRYIAAPFEGRLEKSFVQPGDHVQTGDMLARIDGRDVNWELSGKRAELHSVATERDGHVAAHESGLAEIANREIEKLTMDIQQLEDQAANLDIRSPFDGLVVTGDLSKSEGIPLEKGQMLFEIAPLADLIVEVAVPESDVRFVEAEMPTKILLDAFPMSSERGEIERIHPRAELREHQNVFIAEISIPNPEGKLRPGMRGSAKVATAVRPLGWILFHKACWAAFNWFGW